MTFLNPFGGLLCLALPIIYLLSKNNKTLTKVTVSSLDIWQQLYEESKQTKEKKLSTSLLMILQMSLVVCAALGLSDLYKTTYSEDEIITVLYDTSLSTERIVSKEKIESFISGHSSAEYRLIFIDTDLHEEASLVNARTALKMILSKKPSRRSLDYALLETTYNNYHEEDGAVVVFTDKKSLPLENVITLPADNNNVGIRTVTYNPLKEVIKIKIENESNLLKVTPLEIYFNQKLIVSESITIDSEDYMTYEFDKSSFDALSSNDSGLLTVRLAVEDSLSLDNTYNYPIAMSFDVYMENQNENALKVASLLPYINVTPSGSPIKSLTESVTSNVNYSDDFLKAVKNGQLFTKDLMNSPYFPLWIEDHFMATYNNNLENEIKALPLPLLPKSYVTGLKASPSISLKRTQQKEINTAYFMILFILLLIAEEEVRKRV